jgi:putative radical SAM enzyme (TIGR03279 family)
MVRIASIDAGSIADELELEIGTRIIRINGRRVRDNIDLTFLLSDEDIEVETVAPGGEAVIYEIEKEAHDDLGIVPAPDTIRECANKCVFCFIDGNPTNVRNSLWLRDDDFRLSFTYGSYVTLTNLGPKGFQRLIDQRLSPLYVSVHATDPEVRIRLLQNERAGLIMDQLRQFADAGLDVHTQVVLCPEWNDGEHLDRTIEDLWSLGPAVRSLSIVPVGLTKYNVNKPVRPLRPHEARAAIDRVEIARQRALEARGDAWAYVGDEMFLIAETGLPDDAYYGDDALLENGVGAVADFLRRFEEGLADLPRFDGRRIRIVTGGSMAPFLEERAPMLASATGAAVRVDHIRNDFYGEIVTTAGLLAGRDILAQVGPGSADPARAGDIVLIPGESLNADDLFIDSLPFDELRDQLAPALVHPGHEIVTMLRDVAGEQAA